MCHSINKHTSSLLIVIWSQQLKERKLRSDLNTGQMLLPLEPLGFWQRSIITYALQKTWSCCYVFSINFLNSHYTERALHKLSHYNSHFILLCHDKTAYMQWLSWKVATPPLHIFKKRFVVLTNEKIWHSGGKQKSCLKRQIRILLSRGSRKLKFY